MLGASVLCMSSLACASGRRFGDGIDARATTIATLTLRAGSPTKVEHHDMNAMLVSERCISTSVACMHFDRWSDDDDVGNIVEWVTVLCVWHSLISDSRRRLEQRRGHVHGNNGRLGRGQCTRQYYA